MNILIANNFYAPDVVGGAELSVQGIAEGLARRGHNVTLLTTAMHDEDTALNGVAICRRRFHALMPYIEHVHAHVSPKKIINKVLTIDNPRNAQTIAKVIELHDIDVVLSNNSWVSQWNSGELLIAWESLRCTRFGTVPYCAPTLRLCAIRVHYAGRAQRWRVAS